MKIVIGCSSRPDEGSGILSYAKEVAVDLISRGIEVHFVSPGPRDCSWLRAHGVRHFPTNQGDDPVEAARRLLCYICEHAIDGVINNDNPFLQSIAPGLRCPFIAVGHLGRTSIASLACYRWQWTDYVVAISNDMHRTYVTEYGVPVARCPIIHNGVGDQGRHVDRELRSSRVLRAIYAGGYNRREKGADLLLKAVMSEKERWKGIELDWYGAMPKRIMNALSARSFVRVHGAMSREVLNG